MTKRVAALVGDFYHRAQPMVEVLEWAAREAGCELNVIEDPGDFPWDGLDQLTAVIIAREARIAPAESDAVWVTAAHEAAIDSCVRAGAALAVLHAGLASYDPNGPYVGVARGHFIMHPVEHPRFTISPVSRTHAITDGMEPFEIEDEMYFVRVDAARTTKLFMSAHDDFGSSCAGWAHTHGRGRVFCFTPGHTDEVLAHPAYRAVLERGVEWLVNRG